MQSRRTLEACPRHLPTPALHGRSKYPESQLRLTQMRSDGQTIGTSPYYGNIGHGKTQIWDRLRSSRTGSLKEQFFLFINSSRDYISVRTKCSTRLAGERIAEPFQTKRSPSSADRFHHVVAIVGSVGDGSSGTAALCRRLPRGTPTQNCRGDRKCIQL